MLSNASSGYPKGALKNAWKPEMYCVTSSTSDCQYDDVPAMNPEGK